MNIDLKWLGADLGAFVSGSTEPWAVSVLQALVRLTRPLRLLELGAYEGLTTVKIAEVMPKGAHLTAVELYDSRAAIARSRVTSPDVEVVVSEALRFLESTKRAAFDFAFVDDDHSKAHVAMELDLLLDGRMTSGGLIVGHDVLGTFELAPLFLERNGWIVELPLLHAAGGLGVIQVP